MENKPTNIWTALAVVSVVIVLACGAIWFLSQFVASDIALAILSFAGAIVLASYQYRDAKNRETEARLFSEKQAVYADLTETMLNLFSQKINPERHMAENELANKLQSIKKKLFVWGSFDTIRSLDRMGNLEADGQDAVQYAVSGLMRFSDLIAHMRKDLGHRDPQGSADEIVLGLIKPGEQAMLREALRKARMR